jgi:hypothetical protein
MNQKNISIINPTPSSNVIKHKEKIMRVETHTWDIDDDDLSHEKQLDILNFLNNEIKNETCENDKKNKYINTFTNNIKCKISSYKKQDILKKKLDINNFVSFEYVINLLHESKLMCLYCHQELYILYKQVREMSQWTLDRIDNELGHNINNLVISCLSCNLKRRRINKNSFFITKNMIITKKDYVDNTNIVCNKTSDDSINDIVANNDSKKVHIDVQT